MNNDLISREALKEAIKDNGYSHYFEILEIIDNASTVDTTCPHCDSGYAQGLSDGYLKGKEERPQGKWITQNDFDGFTYWKCSECNKENDFIKFNYCPNCGADMRKEADNEIYS